jgi:hypothetical protein
LGNASNPIPLESVFMGAIFHNYKLILQITREDTAIFERTLEYELTSLLETKSEGKILFYRYSKKWHDFIYSLHKEDRLILLKMVLDVYSYYEYISNLMNIQNLYSLFKRYRGYYNQQFNTTTASSNTYILTIHIDAKR